MVKKINQPLYKKHFKEYIENDERWVGPLAAYKWRHDPRYIAFMLARYKHASKILRGKNSVVDIGCGDALGFPILLQEIPYVHGVDIEDAIISDNLERKFLPDSVTFQVHNLIEGGPLKDKFDSAVCFDVLSSIPIKCENDFMSNVCSSLTDDAIYVMGAQNKLSTKYSFSESQAYQENFKDYNETSKFMKKYFHNVIIFGMNDEVIHTGRETMTQYFISIGIAPRR